MKRKLREKMLNIRESMPPWQRRDYSCRIKEGLLRLKLFKDAVNVMAYIAFKNEVETLPLIEYCIRKNKRIIVPVCIKETRKLLLSELRDPKKELRPGTYNVPEPAPEYIRPFPRESIDIILVPAVAFDKLGFRLGYGGGYYDRFFNELDSLTDKVPSVGLAFESQVIQKVPVEFTDRPVDFVITENELINCIDERRRIDAVD